MSDSAGNVPPTATPVSWMDLFSKTQSHPSNSKPIEPIEADGDSVVAGISLYHSGLVLSSTMDSTRGVTVTPNYQVVDAGSTLLVFSVVGPDLDRFEAALEDDSTVGDPTVLASTDEHRVYRVRITPRAVRFTPLLARLGVRVFDVEADEHGWTIRAQFPSRDALVAFQTDCSDRGITFQVDKLYNADGRTGGERFGLTANQQETLRVASESGYFEVPRRISQEQLAAKVGVSPSAVSQRIRRALNQLLAETVLADDDVVAD